jgi:large subunit ribosomal protein L10
MALKIEDKQVMVTEVAAIARKSVSAIAADYRGLSVAELTQLRTKGRSQDVYVKVIRNTLARRAVADTEFACLNDALAGPNILLFSLSDPGAAARLARDFSKECEKFVVKGIALGGRLLDVKSLKAVADLPTRDQALATFLSLLQAPITKFVRTLAEPHAQVVRTIAAIRDQKQTTA